MLMLYTQDFYKNSSGCRCDYNKFHPMDFMCSYHRADPGSFDFHFIWQFSEKWLCGSHLERL